MRVLSVTNMYPRPEWPAFGVFVRQEIEALRRAGLEIDVLFVNGRESKLNYARGYPRLWRTLARRRYDVIHAHYLFSGLIARAQWREPVVLTHWGFEVFTTWQGPVCRAVTPLFSSVIVQSAEMKERLGYDRVHVIPAGVDLDRFRPMPRDEARAALGLNPDGELVLWAGEHWRPEKRFDIAERAIEILKETRPDVELVLLSGQPPEVVPQYMNACDVLLLSSDAEGSPNVVKEAMACNLPVVSTEVGDVPALVAKADGCYLCEHDAADAAEKVAMALDRGARSSGREAVQPLSLAASAERIRSVYEEAANSSTRAM